MDSKGNIHWNLSEEPFRELQAKQETKLIPLTEKQATMLEKHPPRFRKNHMRNKPCPCGSGRKFKKCCWSAYG